MKNIKIVISLILLLSISTAFAQNGQSFQVIVNKDNSIDQLSKGDLSKMLLKKKTKWEDGVKVVPVDQKSTSKVREVFSESVHNKSVSAIKAYWQKKIFTGKGVPPVEKSGNNEVINFVKKNPGAIGYVSANASTYGVKVVKIK